MMEHIHVHTVVQVVCCCMIQNEKWKKKQKTIFFNDNKKNVKKTRTKNPQQIHMDYVSNSLQRLLHRI